MQLEEGQTEFTAESESVLCHYAADFLSGQP